MRCKRPNLELKGFLPSQSEQPWVLGTHSYCLFLNIDIPLILAFNLHLKNRYVCQESCFLSNAQGHSSGPERCGLQHQDLVQSFFVTLPTLWIFPAAVSQGVREPCWERESKKWQRGTINKRGELVFLEKWASGEKGKFRSQRKYYWQPGTLSEYIDLSVEHK